MARSRWNRVRGLIPAAVLAAACSTTPPPDGGAATPAPVLTTTPGAPDAPPAVATATATPRPGGAWAALAAADSAFAAAALQRPLAVALAAVFADDVLLLAPGAPLAAGHVAARQLLAADAGVAEPMTGWRSLTGRASSDGLHGYTVGRFTRRGGGSVPTAIRYAAYWRRDPSGVWQMRVFMPVPAPEDGDSVPEGFGWTGAAATRDVPPPAAAGPAGVSAVGERQLLAQLRATDSVFSEAALANGLARAFEEFAAPAAVIMPGGGAALWGPAAIRAFYDRTPAGDTLRWWPRLAETAPGGDLGFTIGDGVYEHRPASGEVERHFTKYLTIWERREDGRWRYLFDAGSPQPAPVGR